MLYGASDEEYVNGVVGGMLCIGEYRPSVADLTECDDRLGLSTDE
jgi:hypothetical protein